MKSNLSADEIIETFYFETPEQIKQYANLYGISFLAPLQAILYNICIQNETLLIKTIQLAPNIYFLRTEYMDVVYKIELWQDKEHKDKKKFIFKKIEITNANLLTLAST